MTGKLKVIGLVGMPGSGKSIAVKRLQTRKNIEIISMGDIIREYLRKKGIPINSETLGKITKGLRKEYGDDIIAQLTIKKIESHVSNDDIVVIEGIRSMKEIAAFRKHWPIKILAIHSPPTIRHERMQERKREDDEQSPDYFKARDERELGFGIGDVIALADFMLINDEKTTVEELQSKVENLMEKIAK
ncbi:MAG: AAA family ATPase [Promethearchaeota archaeon]